MRDCEVPASNHRPRDIGSIAHVDKTGLNRQLHRRWDYELSNARQKEALYLLPVLVALTRQRRLTVGIVEVGRGSKQERVAHLFQIDGANRSQAFRDSKRLPSPPVPLLGQPRMNAELQVRWKSQAKNRAARAVLLARRRQ